MADPSALGREFIELIDERLHKPLKTWTLGSYVLALVVAAIVCGCLLVIGEFFQAIYPAAIALANGKAFAALQAFNASMAVKTIMAILISAFITGTFIMITSQILYALVKSWRSPTFNSWREMEKVRKESKSRINRLAFWPVMILALVMFIMIYLAMMIMATQTVLNGFPKN